MFTSSNDYGFDGTYTEFIERLIDMIASDQFEADVFLSPREPNGHYRTAYNLGEFAGLTIRPAYQIEIGIKNLLRYNFNRLFIGTDGDYCIQLMSPRKCLARFNEVSIPMPPTLPTEEYGECSIVGTFGFDVRRDGYGRIWSAD